MTKAGYCAVIVIALLIAGFRYAGWSPVILIAVLALMWFGLSVAISFVSDRRYMRAFGDTFTKRTSNGTSGSSQLGIGRAVLVGELVVNFPAIGLFVGLILPVGSYVQDVAGYNGVDYAPAFPLLVAVAVAFFASWVWWAIVTPRWLLWAMKRVADPIALRNAAVGSILWPDRGLGRAFNKTQWRSTAMKKQEQEIVQLFAHRVRRGQKVPLERT